MAIKQFSKSAMAKFAKGAGLVKRGAKRASQSRLGHRIGVIGSAVVGGAAGGAANGLAGERTLAGLKASTVVGTVGGLVSLFVKGPPGDIICNASAGSLALSTGQATEKAVRELKLDSLLNQLQLPGASPGKGAVKGALASGAGQPQLAGESSTSFTTEDLEGHASGAARTQKIPLKRRG